MKYKKGRCCNNYCKHFFGENTTVYDRNHGGNPGSSDYEVYRMWCCAESEDGVELLRVKYNCPLFCATENSKFSGETK